MASDQAVQPHWRDTGSTATMHVWQPSRKSKQLNVVNILQRGTHETHHQQGAEEMSVNEAKVEVLKVWYSVFCELVDAHLHGELNDFDFTDKVIRLRQKLAEALPEVETEMAKYKQ